jgi:prepilin-type N-terminal cleavage/methylation domain-containing protein
MATRTHSTRLRSKGFSLIELLFAVAIVTLLSGLGILSMRKSTHQAGSRGLASTVVAALTEARLRAISTRSPVAICFPSNAGGTPLSNCLYRLEGATAPALANAQSFSGDFPGIYVFNGIWPTDASTFRNVGSTPVANPVPPGSPWTAYQDPTLWLPTASSKDYCYMFRPDGTVVSNGMVAFDGAYHILVTAGVGSWSGPSSSGGSMPLYAPTLLGQTFSVSLAINGNVQVDNGVVGSSSGSIAFSDAPSDSAPSLANTPLVAAASSANPSNVQLTMLSKEAPLGGINPPDITVGLGGYITLDVTANDSNKSGQRLYAEWTVVPDASNAGTGVSNYSVPLPPPTPSGPGGGAMDWDPTANSGAGGWHCIWGWRPPGNGIPGDRYTLTLVVQDSLGITKSAGISKVVSITPPGKILFTLQTPGNPGGKLGKVNVDGTFELLQNIASQLPLPGTWSTPSSAYQDDYFSASTDGSRIAFRTSRLSSGLPGTPRNTAWTDPSLATAGTSIQTGGVGQILQSVSPAGDMVAYVEYGNAGLIDPAIPFGGGGLYVQMIGPGAGPNNRILVDPDLGFFQYPVAPAERDAFPGMLYRMFTDHITWDPTGGTSGQWTLYYSDFGSAKTDTAGVTVPTPVVKTCLIQAGSGLGPPSVVSGPVPVAGANLAGCFAPNIPYYASAPYQMTLSRWNGGVTNTHPITVWDMSGATVVDQILPPDFYANPIFVPKSTTGQNSIVCSLSSGFVYTGYLSGMGSPNLYHFTPNMTGAAIIDLSPISDPTQGQAWQPAYTPITW